MFLLLVGFVRFIRFNRLYTKPYPNPTVFIKLYPFGLYGIYQNQTILSISVRFGSVRFGFTILNSPNFIRLNYLFGLNLYFSNYINTLHNLNEFIDYFLIIYYIIALKINPYEYMIDYSNVIITTYNSINSINF